MLHINASECVAFIDTVTQHASSQVSSLDRLTPYSVDRCVRTTSIVFISACHISSCLQSVQIMWQPLFLYVVSVDSWSATN